VFYNQNIPYQLPIQAADAAHVLRCCHYPIVCEGCKQHAASGIVAVQLQVYTLTFGSISAKFTGDFLFVSP